MHAAMKWSHKPPHPQHSHMHNHRPDPNNESPKKSPNNAAPTSSPLQTSALTHMLVYVPDLAIPWSKHYFLNPVSGGDAITIRNRGSSLLLHLQCGITGAGCVRHIHQKTLSRKVKHSIDSDCIYIIYT